MEALAEQQKAAEEAEEAKLKAASALFMGFRFRAYMDYFGFRVYGFRNYNGDSLSLYIYIYIDIGIADFQYGICQLGACYSEDG